MHAPNPSSRLAAAISSAPPTVAPMSQNVPKCPTFSPKPTAGSYNTRASDSSDVHQEMCDRLAQLDQFLQTEEAA